MSRWCSSFLLLHFVFYFFLLFSYFFSPSSIVSRNHNWFIHVTSSITTIAPAIVLKQGFHCVVSHYFPIYLWQVNIFYSLICARRSHHLSRCLQFLLRNITKYMYMNASFYEFEFFIFILRKLFTFTFACDVHGCVQFNLKICSCEIKRNHFQNQHTAQIECSETHKQSNKYS